MGRESFISRLGLFLGCLVGVVVILLTIYVWVERGGTSPVIDAPTAPNRSLPGWETRYNATAALARRGSDAVTGQMSTFQEMLNEDQQRHNFRTRLQDGREVPNDVEALQTVTNALKALVELHRKRPEMDLSELRPAIEKLAESSNPALRNEAARAKVELGMQ